MKTTPQTFPYETRAEPCAQSTDVAQMFRRGSVVMLLGQVRALDLGWAGKVRLTLQLSFGEMMVEGNRESVSLDLQAGDWVRVRALRSQDQNGEQPVFRVLSVKRASPDIKAAWLPSALYHREAHMRRLRALLLRLDPALQALFAVVMTDAQVQRRFFWRVGATDHHGYPGGLFDQSVRAAERAYEATNLDERRRGIAALAALLFDLGKTFDNTLAPDKGRSRTVLAPHRLTALRIGRALDRMERLQPELIEELRAVMFGLPGLQRPVGPKLLVTGLVTRNAVRQSWKEGGLV